MRFSQLIINKIDSTIMHEEVMKHLREARTMLKEEQKTGGTREMAIAITAIEDAMLRLESQTIIKPW